MDSPRPLPDDPAAPQDLGFRALGFLVTVAGALAAGIGSMLEWVSIDLAGVRDVPSVYPGIDLAEGKVVLALAVISVIAVLVSRIGATTTSRRAAAAFVIASGVAIAAIAAFDAIDAEDRFVQDEIERNAASVGREAGDLPEDLRAALEERIQVGLGVGIWLALGGGLLATVGGVLTLVWAMRDERRFSDDEPASESAGDRRPRATRPEPPPPPLSSST